MKKGLTFILTYYGISILFFLLAGQLIRGLSGEVLSYVLWFYIYNIVIGVVIFPLIILIVRNLNLKIFWKLLICFLVILTLLNVVPFFTDHGKLITIEALKELFGKGQQEFNFNYIGIHLVAIVTFLFTGMIYKWRFVS